MKKNKWFYIFLFLLFGGLFSTVLMAYSAKNISPEDLKGMQSILLLKKYMNQFGSQVTEIDIVRMKEKKADWEVIGNTLEKMKQTLAEMKKVDREGRYREFTDVLEINLAELQVYKRKKDIRVFDVFENLTLTCFNCHVAHRRQK